MWKMEESGPYSVIATYLFYMLSVSSLRLSLPPEDLQGYMGSQCYLRNVSPPTLIHSISILDGMIRHGAT